MIKTKMLIVLLVVIGFTSCKDYGKKTTKGHIETYYKDGITEDQAKKTAALMYYVDSVSNNAKGQKSFQLCKKNDTVCFRMVVNVEKAKEMGDFSFLAIGNMVSDSVFNGAPVNMDLTNNTFESVKLITYKKLDFDSIEKSNH
ncbi:hypothetical protein [Ferruginibacter sp. SUN106]|uniref:hypothetical protein n=1 Tax=Ferruginibacter sp. SUN106 TaxID=2978348 RepID=UPI003D36EF33